jgi:hypothetical protein
MLTADRTVQNLRLWVAEAEIAAECSVLNIGFSFDVGRSMFDVRRSSFKLKETSHVPERLPRDQKPEDTDADLTQ